MFYRGFSDDWQVASVEGNPSYGVDSSGNHYMCGQDPSKSPFVSDDSITVTDQGELSGSSKTWSFTFTRPFTPHGAPIAIKAGPMKTWMTWLVDKTSTSGKVSAKPQGAVLDPIDFTVLSQDPSNKAILDIEWQEVLDIRENFKASASGAKRMALGAIFMVMANFV